MRSSRPTSSPATSAAFLTQEQASRSTITSSNSSHGTVILPTCILLVNSGETLYDPPAESGTEPRPQTLFLARKVLLHKFAFTNEAKKSVAVRN